MSNRDKVNQLRAARDKLEKTLNSGASSIRHGDKAVQNRSAEEIERQIKRLDAQIEEAEGRRRRSRVSYIAIDRGY